MQSVLAGVNDARGRRLLWLLVAIAQLMTRFARACVLCGCVLCLCVCVLYCVLCVCCLCWVLYCGVCGVSVSVVDVVVAGQVRLREALRKSLLLLLLLAQIVLLQCHRFPIEAQLTDQVGLTIATSTECMLLLLLLGLLWVLLLLLLLFLLWILLLLLHSLRPLCTRQILMMHLLVHSITSLIDYAIVVLIGAPHLQMYGMLEVIPQVLQPEVLIDIAGGVNTRCLPACLGSAHAGTGGGHHINDIIRATASIGSATFCGTRRRVVSESLTIRIGHRVCVRIQISADLFNACRLVEIASNQQICIGAGAGRGAAAGTVALIVASSTSSAVASSFVLLRERGKCQSISLGNIRATETHLCHDQ